MSEKKPDTNPELLDIPRPVQWVIGTVVGVGSGLASAATQIRGEFRKKLVHYGALAKKEEEHGAALDDIYTRRINGNLSTEEYIREMRDKKNAFAKELDDISESKLGIASHGLKGFTRGTVQRFRTLGINTRLPIVFGAITTTVIGGACTMMFFNSMHTRERLEMINDKVTGEKSR